jgi:hypothetical protein
MEEKGVSLLKVVCNILFVSCKGHPLDRSLIEALLVGLMYAIIKTNDYVVHFKSFDIFVLTQFKP